MKYTVDFNIINFEFWSGGKSVMNHLDDIGLFDVAEKYIEMYMDEEVIGHIPSEPEINDFVWFDLEDILMEDGYIDENGNLIEQQDNED